MAHSPAFQFYPKDFLSDPNTVRMDARDVGVYMLLIMECWNRDNRLPKDLDVLAAICRMAVEEFEPIWNSKIKRCFQEMKTFFWHKRLKKEILKQIKWKEEKSRAGKLGADKRWKNNDLQNGSAMAARSGAMARDSSRLVLSGPVRALKTAASQAETASPNIPAEKRIWKDGVDLLTKSGLAEAEARGLLGKMAKDHGKDKLAQAIAITQANNPPDPQRYLGGVLRSMEAVRAGGLIGKYDAEKDAPDEVACQTCVDLGYVRFWPEGADPKDLFQSQTRPCEDCATAKAA